MVVEAGREVGRCRITAHAMYNPESAAIIARNGCVRRFSYNCATQYSRTSLRRTGFFDNSSYYSPPSPSSQSSLTSITSLGSHVTNPGTRTRHSPFSVCLNLIFIRPTLGSFP